MSNILITSHSFIRQYCAYLNHSQLPQYLDLSNCLGLPEEHISIERIGGLKANKKGITYITNHVHGTKPDIVLLELGTNDIADSALTHFVSPQDQVGHLIIQIHIICSELFCYGVKVIICGVTEWHRFWRRVQHYKNLTSRETYTTRPCNSFQNRIQILLSGGIKRKSLEIWKKGQ